MADVPFRDRVQYSLPLSTTVRPEQVQVKEFFWFSQTRYFCI